MINVTFDQMINLICNFIWNCNGNVTMLLYVHYSWNKSYYVLGHHFQSIEIRKVLHGIMVSLHIIAINKALFCKIPEKRRNF